MSRVTAGILALGMFLSGCAINFAKRSPWDVRQLAELSDQLEQFKTLAKLKAEEADQLRRAKGMLDKRLTGNEASVGYDERGLVTRMVDQVLFDPGKAELRHNASGVLDKVAQVLQEVPDQPIGIEGHTDNQPIRHSGWSDNEELSVARANAVMNYLVEKRGVESARLTASGYGESRPIEDNSTAAGRQKNRRVEVVILPQASGRAYREAAHESGRSRYAK
jgi:flagellar motor protein MotB